MNRETPVKEGAQRHPLIFVSFDDSYAVRFMREIESIHPAVHISPLMRTLQTNLESLRPPVAIFDLQTIKTEEQTIYEIMEQVHAQYPSIRVIALGHQSVPSQVIAAMKAGACDFLDREAAPEVLKETIIRHLQSARTAHGTRQGHVIALVGAHENEGEEQIAVNLAAHLARSRPGDVLLLDLNLDGSAMEIDLDLEVTYSVRDAIKELFRLERSVLMDVLPKHKCGLSLLALVSGAGETDEVSPQELATLLSTLRSIFPVIVINAGCLRASYSHPYLVPLCDHVLIVTSQLMRSVKASRDLFDSDLIYEKGETKFSLVISRYDPDIALSPEQIGARLALPILGIIPRAWVLLANGHNAGIPPAISAPRSPYVRAVHGLADRLMSRIESRAAEPKPGALPQIRALVDGLRKTTRPA